MAVGAAAAAEKMKKKSKVRKEQEQVSIHNEQNEKRSIVEGVNEGPELKAMEVGAAAAAEKEKKSKKRNEPEEVSIHNEQNEKRSHVKGVNEGPELKAMEVGATAATEKKKKKSKKRKGQEEVSVHNEQNGKRSHVEGDNESPELKSMEVGAAAVVEKKKKKSKKRKGQEEVSIHNEQNGKRSHVEGDNEGPELKAMEIGTAAVAEKKEKKSKRIGQEEVSIRNDQNEKRSHVEGDNEGPSTISIAVAGSIIDNCQSPELATRLAGQIARAATIFRIDEVIVFDCKENTGVASDVPIWEDEGESGALFLARILQYLEMPQYLRRALIPKHNILRFVGLLPPLDAPHHVRKHEWVPYREGVTLDRKSPAGVGTFVDVGLFKPVFIQQTIEPRVRVTVAMGSNKSLETDCVRQAVKRSEPREKKGLYWGYTVRYAYNISNVFKKSPYKGGYDYSIGTSEHGDIIRSADLVIPKFRHLLIAFGGLGGLEENIEEDQNLKGKGVKQLFHCYLNTCPNQGSRTIRTEEATFISLQYFQDPIQRVRST